MIKIFPFYKGENIANNPLGYTNVANARKRMKGEKVIKDFNETLPEDYWFPYLYTFQNGTKPTVFHMFRRDVNIIGYDLTKKVYLKDIDNKIVIDLFKDLRFYNHGSWYERTEEEWDTMVKLVVAINELGYYPYCWADDKDYWKRYSKFVTKNVEFKEMDVDILKKEINQSI